MDDEEAHRLLDLQAKREEHHLLDLQAEIIALRGAVKLLLRRAVRLDDEAVRIIRDEAFAGAATALDDSESSNQMQYLRERVRQAVTDILPLLSDES